MANGEESSQEFTVQGGVSGFSVGQLSQVEGEGDQDCCTPYWSIPPTCVSEASTAKETGPPGMGCTRMGTVERRSRARWKAASQGRVQSNSLQDP